MTGIGAMQMPDDFRYRKAFIKGMPVHDKWDSFRAKHPAMPRSRWAKIFAPFDALKGFDEAIGSKRNIYVDRIELEEDSLQELNLQLNILKNYTWNSRMAWQNRIAVTITNFQQTAETDQGKYVDISGMVLGVDEVNESVTLQTPDGRTVIYFENILKIKPEKADLFDNVPGWAE